MIFDEMTTMRKLMLLHGVFDSKSIEEISTGNPLTFVTDLARPLKSLLIPFTPQQEGTGDPSPSNIRPIVPWEGLKVWNGGTNLFDGEMELGTYNGNTGNKSDSSTRIRTKNAIPVKGGASYYFVTTRATTFGISWLFYDKDDAFISNHNRADFGGGFTPAVPDNACYMRFSTWDTYGTEYGNDIGFNCPATEKTFVAYAPITETDIVFPAMGKNLLNPANRVASGNNVQYYRWGGRFLLKGGKTYTLSANVIPAQISIFKGTNTTVATTTSATLTYTPTEDVEVWFDIYIANSKLPEGGISAVYGMLELGDTAHPYEPYTNTVYGGTLDVVSGVMKVTHVCLEVSKQHFTISGNGAMPYMQTAQAYTIQHKPKSRVDWVKARQTQKMDCAVIANPYSETTFGNYIGVCFYDTNLPTAVRISKDLYDSLQDGDSVSVCYEIEDPFDVQLTPTQLTALIGDNTIWSDTDGSMTAVYLKKG